VSLLAVVAFGIAGGLLGIAADRLASRWPAHEDGTPVRRPDWRTLATAAAGAAAFACLAARWPEPRDALVLAVAFAGLIVLLATDLDQRHLPNVVTYALAAYAAAIVVVGWDPLLATKSLGVVSAVAAGIGAPVILILTDVLFHGDLGLGDVKLAVGLGLLSGVYLLLAGFLVASLVAAGLLLLLIGLRRIGLRSHIPFGPILIGAGFVAALLPW